MPSDPRTEAGKRVVERAFGVDDPLVRDGWNRAVSAIEAEARATPAPVGTIGACCEGGNFGEPHDCRKSAPAPVAPHTRYRRAKDDPDILICEDCGAAGRVPAPDPVAGEGLDPVPPYTDDRGDLQEAWMRGYHARRVSQPVQLDVERLECAIDVVEEGGIRNGVFDRLTTIDNGRLARAIAAEYARDPKP